MIRCQNCEKLTFESSIDYRYDTETGDYLTECPRCGAIESFEDLDDDEVIELIEDLEFEISALKLKIRRLENQNG